MTWAAELDGCVRVSLLSLKKSLSSLIARLSLCLYIAENVDLKCSLSGATGGVMSIQFDQSVSLFYCMWFGFALHCMYMCHVYHMIMACVSHDHGMCVT